MMLLSKESLPVDDSDSLVWVSTSQGVPCDSNNKRQQYRPKSFPSDIASPSPHDDCRGGNGQKSRESCGLAVCRQEERQHCHDEDAKAEARSALYKTGPDAQQEYGYHNTTHLLPILPMLSDGQ